MLNFFEQEMLFKNILIFKLKRFFNLKINLKLNLKKKIIFIFFFKLKLNLLKKNYYNLFNISDFFETTLISRVKFKFDKIKVNLKKLLKNALKSLIFNKAKFSFYFILFLLKKNHKRKLIILKNYIKKNKKKRKKKKPLIKLSYFKLLKKITSYNNQTLQKNYDSDWTNDLIIRFNFLIRFKKLNLIINNNLTNLIKFNLLKFIKV